MPLEIRFADIYKLFLGNVGLCPKSNVTTCSRREWFGLSHIRIA